MLLKMIMLLRNLSENIEWLHLMVLFMKKQVITTVKPETGTVAPKPEEKPVQRPVEDEADQPKAAVTPQTDDAPTDFVPPPADEMSEDVVASEAKGEDIE